MDIDILVVVPFPLDEPGLDRRREQFDKNLFGPGANVRFRPVRSSGAYADSYHDMLLLDAAIVDAAADAEEEGFDAVTMDTVSDSGMNALRSILSIPIVGPGQSQFHIASMLGHSFGVLTQWEKWKPEYEQIARSYGLDGKLVSVRSIDDKPDLENLFEDKKDEVLPKLATQARKMVVEDGADVICLGSTTMHEAVKYLRAEVSVPVINPGPLSYKIAELLVRLELSHSRQSYQSPEVPMVEKYHAMFDAIEDGFDEIV